jgi:quercetin dioxygenase-like cupin family protein
MRRTAARRRQPAGSHRRRATPEQAARPLTFVTAKTADVQDLPWGRHWWLSNPDVTGAADLALVQVRMPPGTGHQFHYHPEFEEIIYVVEGVAEQWVDRTKERLEAGDIAFIPKGVVHGTYNAGKRRLTFLAILSPAASTGPALVDCHLDEPWRSLRRPLEPGTRRRR